MIYHKNILKKLDDITELVIGLKSCYASASERESLPMFGLSASVMETPLETLLVLGPATFVSLPRPWQKRIMASAALSGSSRRTFPTPLNLMKLEVTPPDLLVSCRNIVSD